MTKKTFLVLIVFALAVNFANAQKKHKVKLKYKTGDKVEFQNFTDSASYMIGFDIGTQLSNAPGIDKLNLEVFYNAFLTAYLEETKGQLSKEELTTIVQELQIRMKKETDSIKNATKMDNFNQEQAYIDSVMQTDDAFKKTASGLVYKIVKPGNGQKPADTSTVTVHYSGYLIDGKKFDSSVDRGQPATFPLQNVIAGWTEGLQLIGEGGKLRLIIPSELGYGERGAQGAIPPYATLIFDVELLEVK